MSLGRLDNVSPRKKKQIKDYKDCYVCNVFREGRKRKSKERECRLPLSECMPASVATKGWIIKMTWSPWIRENNRLKEEERNKVTNDRQWGPFFWDANCQQRKCRYCTSAPPFCRSLYHTMQIIKAVPRIDTEAVRLLMILHCRPLMVTANVYKHGTALSWCNTLNIKCSTHKWICRGVVCCIELLLLLFPSSFRTLSHQWMKKCTLCFSLAFFLL